MKSREWHDDIHVSDTSEEDHLQNLKALLQCLQDKRLWCCQQMCFFAQQSVEYLGYTIARKCITKGHKVETITKLPAPTNVATLRSFIGSIQFYKQQIHNRSCSLNRATDPSNKERHPLQVGSRRASHLSVSLFIYMLHKNYSDTFTQFTCYFLKKSNRPNIIIDVVYIT